MNFLEFAFQSFWHFAGTVFLLSIFVQWKPFGGNRGLSARDIKKIVEDLKKNQINSWERLSKEKIQLLTGSKKMIDGYFSPVGGSLQPALLIRGLKKTAENKKKRHPEAFFQSRWCPHVAPHERANND